MTKLIGTNPNQVPSNADLGTAAFMDKTEFLLSKGSSLSAINAVIPKTAVDVFVYDTAKDSDGGAWRKRTRHTSWYKEKLNTTVRGSRREFPAVAVLVLEAGGSTEGTSVDFTIYDGDDPDMPMWMQYRFVIGSGSNTGISALNGIITFCATDNGVLISDFVKDRMRLHNHVHRHTYGVIAPGRLGRSTVADVLEASVTGYSIVNQICNDVAMTVLPNAPIDSATGLPTPTIALATNGGVSVIKDNGTVVDYVSPYQGSDMPVDQISFIGTSKILFSHRYASEVVNLVSSDDSAGYYNQLSSFTGRITNSISHDDDIHVSALSSDDNIESIALNQEDAASKSVSGLSLANHYQVTSDPDRVSCFITSDYNTGWMNGDIKLATLSDTDDTNVISSNLVTGDNSTFTGGLGNWYDNSYAGNGSVLTNTGGHLTMNTNGTYQQAFITISNVLEIGKRYVFSWDQIAQGSGNFRAFMYTDTLTVPQGSTGQFGMTFVATGVDLTMKFKRTASSGNCQVDNIRVSLAEADRSVNGKGLQVFGTVTKTPVATGADLVAYSGFSSSNYLKSSYDSGYELIPGQEMCGMFWVYMNSTPTNYNFFMTNRPLGGSGSNWWQVYTTNNNSNINSYLYSNGSTFNFTTAKSIPIGAWTHVTFTYKTGESAVYINGVKDANTGTPTIGGSADTNNILKIGVHFDNNYPLSQGKISLARVSKTIPSPEQIKKIYNDEKHLFQENAKATLYGTSDAVTALAYDDDTELLHAGTSAGRSDFQGLCRINNTTRAVGTAISAVDGFIVEE